MLLIFTNFLFNQKTHFMQLQTASRKKVKIKMNIASPSGFGKTYSALLLAYGITGDWDKIAVIDTENDSASLYSHLGPFKTLRLDAPYSPDRYIEAITAFSVIPSEARNLPNFNIFNFASMYFFLLLLNLFIEMTLKM